MSKKMELLNDILKVIDRSSEIIGRVKGEFFNQDLFAWCTLKDSLHFAKEKMLGETLIGSCRYKRNVIASLVSRHRHLELPWWDTRRPPKDDF